MRKHGAGRAGDERHGKRSVPACSGSYARHNIKRANVGRGKDSQKEDVEVKGNEERVGGKEEEDEEEEEEGNALHGEGILPRGDQDRTNMSSKGSIEKALLPFSTEVRVGAKGKGFRVALKGKYRCRIHILNPKP